MQQQTLGCRGHAEDPLYRAWRDLRRGLAQITDRQWGRLEFALVVGDPSGQLTDTWMAAQELQFLYVRQHDLADVLSAGCGAWIAARPDGSSPAGRSGR